MNSRLKINKLKNKSLSEKSKKWLKKHMNDTFVRQAQKEGYISRAAYKILEIQQKFKLISKSHNIVELGSSPGGWSQVVSQILHTGRIFAIDLLPMKFVHHKIFFVQGDFVSESSKILEKIEIYNKTLKNNENNKILEDNKLSEQEIFSHDEKNFQIKSMLLKKLLSEGSKKNEVNDEKNSMIKEAEKIKINGILSDMAPNSSGDNQVDHWRTLDLANNAYEFAKKNLVRGGYFVVKIFFGGDEKEFVQKLKKDFKEVCFFKPDSSRKESSEIYIVARNFLQK